VQDLSRLARNLGDQISTISALGALQFQLISLDENFDDSAAGKASRNMVGLMSQFFSDSLSEKTKVRMAAAVKSGRFVWVAPVGYVNDLATKNIKVDCQRAPLIRQGFEMLATGAYAADDVLRTLNGQSSRRIIDPLDPLIIGYPSLLLRAVRRFNFTKFTTQIFAS